MLPRYSTTVVSAGTTDNRTLGEVWLFCTKWKHETGLVFVIYDVVKHIVVQDYYLNLRCTAQKTLSFFSVQKSVLIAIICKIIYFMKSYHDKQYAKCFKHQNNENNLRKEHIQQ